MKHQITKRQVTTVVAAIAALGAPQIVRAAEASDIGNNYNTDDSITTSVSILNGIGSGSLPAGVTSVITAVSTYLSAETSINTSLDTAIVATNASIASKNAQISSQQSVILSMIAVNPLNPAISTAQSTLDIYQSQATSLATVLGDQTNLELDSTIKMGLYGAILSGPVSLAQSAAISTAATVSRAAAQYAAGTDVASSNYKAIDGTNAGLQTVIDSLSGLAAGDPSAVVSAVASANTAFPGVATATISDIQLLATVISNQLPLLPVITSDNQSIALEVVLNGAYERNAVLALTGTASTTTSATTSLATALSTTTSSVTSAAAAISVEASARASQASSIATAVSSMIHWDGTELHLGLHSLVTQQVSDTAGVGGVQNLRAEDALGNAIPLNLVGVAQVNGIGIADVSQVASLASAITVEASARSAADTSLATAITAEASSRAAADTSIVTAVSAADSSLAVRISTEEVTRAAADTSLTSRLSTEEVTRAAADVSIVTAVSAADSSLAVRISTEEVTRATADTSLTSRVSTEEVTRAAADASLLTVITTADTSIVTRFSAADASLLTVVTTADTSIVTRFSTADLSLQTRVSAEESTRALADTSLQTRLALEETTRAAADATLSRRIFETNREVNRIRRGVAMAAALQTPVIAPGKDNAVKVGVAHFDGETGLAAGYARRVSDSTTINAEVATTTDFDETIARGGVNYSW